MKEWESEPNELKFEHNGFKCLIRRQPELGTLCGYVALPPKHPYYGMDFDKINVDVHGGLTFSYKGDDTEGWSKGYWWIGFDCSHAMDFVPYMERYNSLKDDRYSKAIYKNIGYVKNELISLTEQLLPLNMAIQKLIGE